METEGEFINSLHRGLVYTSTFRIVVRIIKLSTMRETERERDRDTERETETERDRERERERKLWQYEKKKILMPIKQVKLN